MAFLFRCPYCQHPQTVTDNFTDIADFTALEDSSRHGILMLHGRSIACANLKCRELTVRIAISKAERRPVGGYRTSGAPLYDRQIWPESSARPLPTFIPAALISDYNEACQIRGLSPKASATLSRRCLQGMIRDFFKISKPRLIDEIKELRKQLEAGSALERVALDTIDAIDGVREIGNIGAHMEADINMIVDVDANEAQTLIELLEVLFDEWYVAKQTRLERLGSVTALRDLKREQKDQQKQIAAPTPAALPSTDKADR